MKSDKIIYFHFISLIKEILTDILKYEKDKFTTYEYELLNKIISSTYTSLIIENINGRIKPFNLLTITLTSLANAIKKENEPEP
jgi:hypothetical protein